MRHVPITLLAAALVAACSGSSTDKPVQPQASAETGAAQTATAAAIARPAAAAKAVAVHDGNQLYDFEYTYPAQAAAIPMLAAWLNADLGAQKRDLTKNARLGQAEAKRDARDYYPFGHSTRWAVVTDLPGWLSLSAQRWEFTGGAHPNPWSEGLVWDKVAGKQLKGSDLFASPAALSAAIRRPFCAELDKQRAARRGEPLGADARDPFVSCIDPLASTVILGSGDKAHFTRIGVLVDPYEAGPYAEGNYEVTLPVTAAVLRAAKPEYRSAFAAAR